MDHLSQLEKSMEEMKAMFASRMATFESAAGTGTIQQDSSPASGSNSGEYIEFKTFLWKAVESLQEQMGFIHRALEDLETRSRSNILLLHGSPETQNEDVSSVAVNIIHSSLSLEQVSSLSFLACHRLGRVRVGSKPRPILIKFACQRTRDVVWAAKKLLKGSGRTLTEFLTSSRHAVFLEARKQYGVRGSWTSDGRIIVQCHDGVRRKVTTLAELHALPVPEGAVADVGAQEAKPGPAGTEAGIKVAPPPGQARRANLTRSGNGRFAKQKP